MYRLLEAIFRLNVQEYVCVCVCVYIYMLQCRKMDEISFTLSY